MAQAASRREEELLAHMSTQTVAAQQRAEEAESKTVETCSSERRAALTVHSQAADAKSAFAAVAAARLEGERAAK
eukprot:2773876-Pyramimonas_sp.AAC.1